MPQKKSSQIALGGMSAALCVALMFLSGVLPFATYALPALAGIALIPAALEMGGSTAAVAYVAVAFLSFFLAPDKETAAMFAAFFGYYPILRPMLERVRPKALCWGVKLALFNAAMVFAYQVVIRLFGMAQVLEELNTQHFGLILLAFGNVGFVIYDRALVNLTRLYLSRWRGRYLRR